MGIEWKSLKHLAYNTEDIGQNMEEILQYLEVIEKGWKSCIYVRRRRGPALRSFKSNHNRTDIEEVRPPSMGENKNANSQLVRDILLSALN
ncbi:hypothetical protein BABINDRAFT_118543 [Babjeviella inositovora NRRL Y-12698]|uniref:Uncharacterized protein n=1 Tax=Babjeviella inositovora NRRL Y-12698 TaxID=984486 RepID=A0A1E3QVG9_9ASCO|nr:uncharacterized protein BABINDRAFT_118543 [Babjeviella inositovora NRRL Y-12698]ODQ80957.1 hypothetical protein BABINDRAFT_118543 [Babjeviella inositovora NRRL Y-12698]